MRFALRQQLDRLAARWLPDDVEAVYAPSFCARRTFAEAARRPAPITCHLVEDLPDLRRLHADLDMAAAAHPDARFLRRHRATPQQVATQQSERVLADVLHVRGHFARDLRIADGHPPERIRLMASSPVQPAARRTPNGSDPVLLLAGLATARSGTYEAVAALDALPNATLLVHPGEGLEPPDLLRHPRVRAVARDRAPLDGVDVVLAPTWCEAHVPVLDIAAARGVPIVATLRAAGAIDLASAGTAVEPGDGEALARAVAHELLR